MFNKVNMQVSICTLKDILSFVNDWLKFAEAKNSVLMATTGFAIWIVARLLLTVDMHFTLYMYFLVLVAFFFLAFVTAIISFLPVLSYTFINPVKNEQYSKNLLYFGYLSTLNKNDLLKQLYSMTGISETQVSDISAMYAEQIIINSRIALAKYTLFEKGVSFILLGALTPPLGIAVLYLAKKKKNEISGFK